MGTLFVIRDNPAAFFPHNNLIALTHICVTHFKYLLFAGITFLLIKHCHLPGKNQDVRLFFPVGLLDSPAHIRPVFKNLPRIQQLIQFCPC